ncbi:MAG: alpha/beta hydrolase [Pseudomonadota bacterium]
MTQHITRAPVKTFNPPSGRAFSYCEFGAADGHPVLAFHGTPGSRLKYEVAHEAATGLGLRLLSIDRWGYGGTPAPPRDDVSLHGFGQDMRALIQSLGKSQASIVGISGGGPYAMATAAVLKGKASKLALVAPVAPLVGANAVSSAVADMRMFHKLAFFGVPKVPGLSRVAFGALRSVLKVNGPAAMRLVTARAGPSDRVIACAPENAARLSETFRLGLEKTTRGAAIDMQVFSSAWDVDVGDIASQTRLWIGTDDRNVPIPPAKALQTKIRKFELTELPGAGHFWITKHYADVLGWLASKQ